MTKISTLFVVAGVSIATIQTADAQTGKSPWTFGVKTGVNIANTSSKNEKGRTGFNVGGTVEYQLNNSFFLQSGLEFTTKGSKWNDSYSDYPFYPNAYGTNAPETYTKFTGHIKATQNLMYLQLPLTVGYRLPVAKDINLTFNAGGYMAYRTTARMPYEMKGTLKDPDGKTNPVDSKKTYTGERATNLERFDYGLLGGIGVEYKKFSFNVNYELGLRNLNNNSGTYINHQYNNSYSSQKIKSVPKWKNQNISLSVGYKF